MKLLYHPNAIIHSCRKKVLQTQSSVRTNWLKATIRSLSNHNVIFLHQELTVALVRYWGWRPHYWTLLLSWGITEDRFRRHYDFHGTIWYHQPQGSNVRRHMPASLQRDSRYLGHFKIVLQRLRILSLRAHIIRCGTRDGVHASANFHGNKQPSHRMTYPSLILHIALVHLNLVLEIPRATLMQTERCGLPTAGHNSRKALSPIPTNLAAQ